MRKRMSVEAYMDRHIKAKKEQGVKQREIAIQSGFARSPNSLSIFKNGESPVPISRIKAIAEAMGADTKEFAIIVLRQQYPEFYQLLNEYMFEHTLSDEEMLVAKEAVENFRASKTIQDPQLNMANQ